MISMTILMVASFAAVFAKKVYLYEVNKQERRDFFKSIDWTQPEKIKDEDIKNSGPDNQIIVNYLRKAICPSILLFGAVASQPFYVISMHVINTRYNNQLNAISHKESAARNSYRAFFYIRR